VEFVEYDPAWPDAFERERVRIVAAVPPGTAVDHIGSTAIPGMPAKPILDIMIVAADPAALIPMLEAIGYEYRPASFAEDPRHFFLRIKRGERRTHHVHLLEEHSERVAQYRLFRDYLIAHPPAAARYAQAKRDLAARLDRPGYLAAKPAVVAELLADARRWRG
jgi:GrpB-like predicted nucleotidyltransferase (UPF0157 family)